MIDIEFVTASHDDVVLYGQLKRSPIFNNEPLYPLSVVQGFTNVAKAYNEIGPVSDLIAYVHHDVYLPPTFIGQLISSLNKLPPHWGVVGVAGVRLIDGQKKAVGHVLDRGRPWGSPVGLPAEVDTLDELLLITTGDFRFDEQFSQDFYGADLCLQAREQGRKCYAIAAYCQHNSGRAPGARTQSFFESQDKFREKWKSQLPIATTCSLVR